MEILLNVLTTVFWGLVMFSLIVLVHEAGHFTAAKLCGMRVREFMLGLPGSNLGIQIGETRFGVTPFLLGGYALVAGMQFEAESPTLARALALLAERGSIDTATAQRLENSLGYELEADLDQLTDWGTIQRRRTKGGFYRYEMKAGDGYAQGQAREISDADSLVAAERKLTYLGAPYHQRVIMLLAGAFFNLVFAIIVFTAAMMYVGDGQLTKLVDSVTAGSPAAAAGIMPGDDLLSIDGQETADWQAFYDLIGQHAVGDQVVVAVLRDGQTIRLEATLGDNNGRAFLGVSPYIEPLPVSFTEALGRSFSFIGIVAVTIAGLLNPATTGQVISQSSSVVGVSVEAANAASAGFLPFIVLAAGLSISIGLMNLLPIPPLDGGKIVLETIQRLLGRPIPIRVINSISVAALVMLGLLFVTVTWQDIQHYIIGG